MPIEFCQDIAPLVLKFSELGDSQVKVQTYLTLEVLFASRRFTAEGAANADLVSGRIFKSLLDNAEIVQSMTVDQQDDEEDEEGVKAPTSKACVVTFKI